MSENSYYESENENENFSNTCTYVESNDECFEDNPMDVECPDIYTLFQELYASYKYGDAVGREEAGVEAKRYVIDYLDEPLIDPSDIEDVLLPLDRIIYARDFKEIRDYTIDINGALSELEEDVIQEYWDRLVEAGVSADDLAKHAQIRVECFNDISSLLSNGVSASLTFKLSEALLKGWADDGHYEDVLNSLVLLENSGLSHLKISEFAKASAGSAMVDNIVEKPNVWRQIGVKPEDYFDAYIKANGVAILSDPYEFDRHKSISELTRIIEHMYPSDILEAASNGYDDLLYFFRALHDYVDVNVFEKKFMKKLVRGINEKNLEFAIALYINGSNLVKADEIKSVLAKSDLDTEKKEYYTDELEIYEARK